MSRPHLFTLHLYHLFFFNHTATTEIYTLSLHDALPISHPGRCTTHRECQSQQSPLRGGERRRPRLGHTRQELPEGERLLRSEEHTSELQSPDHLVCRLLLEKKKKKRRTSSYHRK